MTRYLSALWLLAVSPALPGADAAEGRAHLPVFFIQDSPARLLAEGPEMRASFSPEGVVYQTGTGRIQTRFVGARAAGMEGADAAGQANFLIGQDPRGWRTGLPAYQEVLYRQLYPGIDLAYRGAGGRLKSEFRVAPGADPSRIRIEYSADLSLDAEGRLQAGSLRDDTPEVYQEIDRESKMRRVPVEGHYRLIDARTVGFEISHYDRTLPLVIDPVISYSTYLGGNGLGAVTGVAVDTGGNLYATGWTEALNFPTAGATQAVNLGGVDAFVVKVSPTGSALIYATYIGGAGEDKGAAIAVDSSGQAHVAGSTASSNFPLAAPAQALMGGSKTAFALKLNAAGNALLFSTYLGGTTYDVATAVAVDAAGNTYVAGDTQSTNFPLLHASQITSGGNTDAFAVKLTPAGALALSTYLGGTAVEHAGGIAADASGNIYVAGGTNSINFPVITPAIQGINGGSQDVFVTKLAAAGTSVVYSTYLGGNGGATPEQANGIVVDASGNAYITGVTNSANFPVTLGAYQTIFDGVSDAFVTKINAAGTALVFSTFLGGSDFDWASGIGLDSGGNVYIAGYTSSFDFPVVNAVQSAFNGFYDAFIAKIGAAGNAVGFSTYFGGSGADAAYALAVDGNGNMYVGGQTSSLNLPLAAPIQSVNNGSSTGWLARVGVTPPPLQLPSVTSVTPSAGSGSAPIFTATYSDTGGAAALTTVSLLVGSSAATAFSCYVTYNRASNVFILANDDPTTGGQTVVPGGGTAQNSQCTLTGAGSTASVSGNVLTATIALAFFPAFAGPTTLYLYAADAGANTGFVAEGIWNVSIPAPQPSAVSVAPNVGTGPSQTFTFVFSDSQNAANLTGLGMLFASTVTFTNVCYIVVDTNAGTVGLVWDNGLGSNTRLLGSTTPLQNSQCSVGASSLTVAGLFDTITVAVTFTGAIGGPQNIFMYGASGGLNTGWVQRGTFTVTAGGVPQANSVVPASGSGQGQRFSFTISDPGGSGFLTGLEVLFAQTLNTQSACLLAYDRNAGTISLSYENPANGSTPLVPGSTAVVSNNQCTISGPNTTVVIGTTSIIVTMDMAFASSWFGPKNIYLLASESSTVNTGFVTVGTWTVTGGSATADSVSPASGTGSSPNFTFTVSDSSIQSNISGMSMLITTGAPTNLANACYLIYNRGNTTNSTIGLYDNTGTILTTKGIGSSTTLQNTQCSVGYTAVTESGRSVMLTINVVFGTFSGPKTVYLQGTEPGSNSGFVDRGTWTVP